uniref:Putative secreted protein n=1 Tax=Anopheles darlingi TaxID=43151 RepID=A0A2M4D6C0_ANODA
MLMSQLEVPQTPNFCWPLHHGLIPLLVLLRLVPSVSSKVYGNHRSLAAASQAFLVRRNALCNADIEMIPVYFTQQNYY